MNKFCIILFTLDEWKTLVSVYSFAAELDVHIDLNFFCSFMSSSRIIRMRGAKDNLLYIFSFFIPFHTHFRILSIVHYPVAVLCYWTHPKESSYLIQGHSSAHSHFLNRTVLYCCIMVFDLPREILHGTATLLSLLPHILSSPTSSPLLTFYIVQYSSNCPDMKLKPRLLPVYCFLQL